MPANHASLDLSKEDACDLQGQTMEVSRDLQRQTVGVWTVSASYRCIWAVHGQAHISLH